MADQKQFKERKIPVFSVWKNNVILKNIFLVNIPPSFSDQEVDENGKTQQQQQQQELEETLVVGRHPDCDIRLEHPSISRFHLRIYSKPSSLHLFLTDLSSVHGTWISGSRMEPNVRTMMKEGDTLKIGGSSRVYKLHWIPLNQAYDTEHPFVPPLDIPDPQEDDEEEILQDENYPGKKNEDVDVVDSVSKSLDSMVTSDDNTLKVEENNVLEKEANEELVPGFDSLESLFNDEDVENCEHDPNSEAFENEDDLEMDSILECLVPLFLGENWEWVGKDENHLAGPEVDYNPPPLKHEDDGFIASVLEGSNASFLDENSPPVHKYISPPPPPPLLDNMTCNPEPNLSNVLDNGEREGEPNLDDINHGMKSPQQDVQESMWNFWGGSMIQPHSPAIDEIHVGGEEKENQYPICKPVPGIPSQRKSSERDVMLQNLSMKDHETSELWSFWSGNMGIESVCSPFSSVDGFSESQIGSLGNSHRSPEPFSSVKSRFERSLITPDKNSAQSIWSRRGKQESAPQVLTSRTEGKNSKNGPKHNMRDPISRALFHEVDDQEEKEIFTPDKENLTPNTYRSLRKFAVMNEMKLLNTGKSSFSMMLGSPDFHDENVKYHTSEKEIFSTKAIIQEKETLPQTSVSQSQEVQLNQRNNVRGPFQILLADSPHKSISDTSYPDAASICCVKSKAKTHMHLQDKCSERRIWKWNMVVDTTTLLNKESRKALQLLEGLKGTQLIIPRIVIRELDCLKRQTSFFRRNSEVSTALEWVQDTMIKSLWWIRVQSSIEEGGPVAPTPPGSPTGSVTSVSLFGSQAEVLSPTADDHVLDYALSFRKTHNDEQLVLLSNDVTMKIKAMAEGLICEGAEEFRESLINPFSERFLWADSSPRGQTWSCSDDVVLKEKFYPNSLKMTPKAKENIKGLKLILLHNSQYFERMTAIN